MPVVAAQPDHRGPVVDPEERWGRRSQDPRRLLWPARTRFSATAGSTPLAIPRRSGPPSRPRPAPTRSRTSQVSRRSGAEVEEGGAIQGGGGQPDVDLRPAITHGDLGV